MDQITSFLLFCVKSYIFTASKFQLLHSKNKVFRNNKIIIKASLKLKTFLLNAIFLSILTTYVNLTAIRNGTSTMASA